MRTTKRESLQRKQIVDEFGRLDAELAPVKTKIGRHKQLAILIRSWHADLDAESSFVAPGDLYEALVGPKSLETHINSMREIYRALGHNLFLETATVTLKALEQNLDPASFLKLTRKERTGTRSLIAREMAAKARAAA